MLPKYLLLLSSLLLSGKLNAFLPQAPFVGGVAGLLVQRPPRGGVGVVQRATAENALGEVSTAAEVWESFEEKDHDRFLLEFWQKKPLLIRRAVPGLADNIVRRLVGVESLPTNLELAGHVFSKLGNTHWTLLVNEVNRHVPEVSDLLGKFRFVPAWRVDDVMVSYASEGGSVGPHVDSYDVFLLQGSGKRRWAIEGSRTSDEMEKVRSVQDIDVRVLADFKEDQAWVLEPGDALYLPPRVAHYGVSLDEKCMTYSVGFRAPSVRDLVAFFGDHVSSTVTKADHFFADPDLRKQNNHGLISREAVSRAREMIRKAVLSALDDDDDFDRWFGEHVTRSRQDHTGYPVPMDDLEGLSFGYQLPEDVTSAIRRAYRKGNTLSAGADLDNLGPFVYHAEGITFAFVEHMGSQGGTTLFVDGNVFPLPARRSFMASLICKSSRLSPQDLGPALEGEHGTEVGELLHLLLKGGFIYPADD